MKYFETRNPNADVFIVPQEEGGTEDDNYFGSIGDATMRHVQSLGHGERQLWEELIHMGSGAIFRPVPSFESNDKDPFNLKGKDLEEVLKEFKATGASEQSIAAFKEAIEVEAQRRETSEDALDRGELVGYDEWEENPQMWNAVDIPSSPRDKMIYLGNTSQVFYDSFPEGHPDADFINRVLRTLDREWCGDEQDVSYSDWIINSVIAPASAKEYVKRYLEQMVTALSTGEYDNTETVEKYLKTIDDEWGYRFREQAKKKFLEGYKAWDNEQNREVFHPPSEMGQVIRLNAKMWQARFNNGEPVYADIKKFGSDVFNDRELSGKMTGTCWAMYHRVKRRFCPVLRFKGVDLNRCSVEDLREVLDITDKQARTIWHKRHEEPFTSLHALRYKGYITKKSFALTEEAAKLIDVMEKSADECKVAGNFAKLIHIRQKLNRMQVANQPEMSADQWHLLWDYYKILKSDVQRAKNGDQEEGEINV